MRHHLRLLFAAAALCAALSLGTGRGVAAEAAATGAEDLFPRAPALERDVQFWIRIYTEVTTNEGLLHDDWNLGLVYEVLRFGQDASPAQRRRRVEEAKSRYAALLRRFESGDTENLSADEARILHEFGEQPSASDFREAIERIRFQLGQADRFHEGLIRAAVWEKECARILARRGVPAEIAALPHVESSFDIAAYSKVGAAGMWQFMPGTARRYMRVDYLVDERLDPYSATQAAADLMLYNYHLVGTWPLAVTAYNHGPGGLRTAQEELGTSDIDVIVKRYRGKTFGFASRNFYVAFLAALEVDRHADRYFGRIAHLPDTESTTLELPDYIAVDVLAKAFKANLGALRVLNPALRPPIWNNSRFVPRGYLFRLPGAQSAAQISEGWARLPMSERYLAQRNDGKHRLGRGETLASVAAANGLSLSSLLSANGFSNATAASRNTVIKIPLPASRGAGSRADHPAEGLAADAAPVAAVLPAPVAAAVPPPASAPDKIPPQFAEPVSERQTNGSSILPVVSPVSNQDTTDYAVFADNTVVVQATETLGHFARWTHVSTQQLRTLNKLGKNTQVSQGRKIKLDLSQVTAADFAAARRDYHRQQQASFFAAHRIAGTESYTVKRGDSLWTVAARRNELPVWLIAQYNPDVNLSDIRLGTSLVLPQVVAINRQ